MALPTSDEPSAPAAQRNFLGTTGARNALIALGATALVVVIAVVASYQEPPGNPWEPEPALFRLERWRAPIEHNAFVRLPALTRDTIAVAFAAEGQRGWTVGNGGTILATRDGGVTWRPQASGLGTGLVSVATAPDGQHVWAVGLGGRIVATRDGGATWLPQTSGTEGHLSSVAMTADGQRAWAVGVDGTIVATRDAGATWVQQPSGTKSQLTSVAITADGQRAWAVGFDGTILVSRDGGATWQPRTSGTPAHLLSVAVTADGHRGWAVGDAGTILATRDGGDTWSPQASGTETQLWAVAATADGQRVWAVGFRGTIVATRDGGGTWRRQSSGTETDLKSVAIAGDGRRAWAVGHGRTVLATRDGGDTWLPQTSGRRSDLSWITVTADGQRGWAVGDGGTMLATRDGGATWRLLASGTRSDLWSVAIADDGRRGWAVGDAGLILRTPDGGATWQRQPSGTENVLRAVVVVGDGQRGWAVGDKGTIVATRDGGATWQGQNSGTEHNLWFAAVAGDGQRAWAVGGEGTILVTRDGGATWRQQRHEAPWNLWWASMSPDGQRGWVVGSQGTILVTRDGGATWRSQAAGTQAHLWSVAMTADGQRGWAVGRDGTILATRDAGATWQPQASGTQSSLWSVAISADGQRAWAVGERGTLLATRDGGGLWRQAAYRKLPALWFYLAVAAILGVATWWMWRNIRRARPDVGTSITDKGVTDEPISRADQDRLGFKRLVLGLTRYLRNAQTRPPLTIAVSAPWGRGKSSVMRMLLTELSALGVRCVWFNPWHHEKEDVLLAPLVETIRRQGIPSAMSWYGVRFRVRLLMRRAVAHPYKAASLAAALVLPLLHFGVYGKLLAAVEGSCVTAPGPLQCSNGLLAATLDGLAELWRAAQSMGLSSTQLGESTHFLSALLNVVAGNPERLVDTLSLVVFGVACWLLIHNVRAFPDSPSVLLASLGNRAKAGDLDAKTAFRRRFRDNFLDVCESLAPRMMVVFVDDLDRCEPAKAAEMLEALNYLVNSGRCFVVLGMARDVVEAQLALHYEDLATRYEQMAGADRGPRPAVAGDGDAPAAYARKYLRKLVNLEVRLPDLSEAEIRRLLEIELLEHMTESRWLRVADWLDAAGSAFVHRLAFPLVVVAVTAYLIYAVAAGMEAWDRAGHAQATQSGKRLEAIRRADREAAVVLDYARGREKRIASELYNRDGYVLSGLDLRLPAEEGRRTALKVAEVCPGPTPGGADPGETGKPPWPAPDRMSQAVLIECWRQLAEQTRTAEHHAADIKAEHAAALAAVERDDFRRVKKALEKATAAAAAAVAAVKLPAVVLEPSSRQAAQQSTEPTRPTAGETITYHPTSAAAWPYYFAVGLSLCLGLGALVRRERFVIADTPEFMTALRVWDRLLGADPELNTPREIKRFMNRARYYATRLRGAPETPGPARRMMQRLTSNLAPPCVGTSIPENLVVGLAALYHVRPRWFPEHRLFGGDDEGRAEDRQLNDWALALKQEHLAKFGVWPRRPRDLREFLAVVGELADQEVGGDPSGAPDTASVNRARSSPGMSDGPTPPTA